MTLQTRVKAWTDICFGRAISSDTLERADRFTEEALELAQTTPEFTRERAHALVDYVFDRPTGNPVQEVGGVMITLAALCNANNINLNGAANTEMKRISNPLIMQKIRAKQAAKPTGSALPQ
jgi:NTP pyrophosphatase (non-canonical NTP hydrolase)